MNTIQIWVLLLEINIHDLHPLLSNLESVKLFRGIEDHCNSFLKGLDIFSLFKQPTQIPQKNAIATKLHSIIVHIPLLP